MADMFNDSPGPFDSMAVWAIAFLVGAFALDVANWIWSMMP